jgi:hypothetical protein
LPTVRWCRRAGPASGSFRSALVYSCDILAGQDAIAVDSYDAADASLTNPPYTRE